jgi:iron complex outermembrane receptor protein
MGLGDAFGAQFSVTHFDILVKNTVEEPTVGFLFGECYVNNPNLSSGFCERITRDPATGLVDLVDAGFINIGLITSRGFDFNALFDYDGFTVGGEALALSLDARATFLLEQTETVIDSFDDNVGEVGTPKWRGQATFIADWANWRGLWRSRYIGYQETDAQPPAFGTPAQGNTCRPFLAVTGAARDTTDVECRDVNYLNDYILHDASVTWRNDVWSATVGINNVFDKKPPRADSAFVTVSDAGNYPLGVGYDFFGRTLQFSVKRNF